MFKLYDYVVNINFSIAIVFNEVMGYIKIQRGFGIVKISVYYLENYVSLIVTQGLIYILPLLIDPYLGRVIGVDKKD